MGCFRFILVAVAFLLVVITVIRWFEQTAEAVDNRWWNKLALLIACPFVVWLYPSRVGTGRATPVPHHEPVRGFGSLPKSKPPQLGQKTSVVMAFSQTSGTTASARS